MKTQLYRYPFISVNFDIIRNYFITHAKSPSLLSREHGQELVEQFLSANTAEELMQDDLFCQQVAEYFFHPEIISLFGNYKDLLSLPSIHHSEGLGGDAKYFSITPEFFSKDTHAILSISEDGKPALVFRLWDKTQDKELTVVINARYWLHGGYGSQHDLSEVALGHGLVDNQHPQDVRGYRALGLVYSSRLTHYINLQSESGAYEPRRIVDIIKVLFEGETIKEAGNEIVCLYAQFKKAENYNPSLFSFNHAAFELKMARAHRAVVEGNEAEIQKALEEASLQALKL